MIFFSDIAEFVMQNWFILEDGCLGADRHLVFVEVPKSHFVQVVTWQFVWREPVLPQTPLLRTRYTEADTSLFDSTKCTKSVI